ncbi:MAG TPA: MlrC C-terminal domain-containing protein, partial [Gemmataceae bacterium]
GPAFVCLHDPEAVRRCEAAGAGGGLELEVGGRGAGSGPPLRAAFTVAGLYDGKFRETAARHGGFTAFDQGRTAVVRAESGLTVMVTSRRMVPFSLQQLLSCGVEPKEMRFLVAKGVHAPAAAYEAVCPSLVRVDTPGLTTADLSRLEYRRRRRPLFPFEPGAPWQRGEGG